jgi:tRNA(Ile)-lysidine synthase TilS/MesJ
MSDNWEDDDYEIPVLNVPILERLERLEERLERLEKQNQIEEADIELSKELFANEKEEEEDLAYEDLKRLEQQKFTHIPNNSLKKKTSEKAINKQKENEQKQKDLSKKLKEEKAKKKKVEEVFGEAVYDDEYANYEDKFY